MTKQYLSKSSGKRFSWFFISVMLHVVAVGMLIFFTPIREILIAERVEKKPNNSQMSSEKLASVSARLDQITEDRISQNLRALQDLFSQMDQVNQMDLPEFTAFEHQQIQRTPEMVNEHLLAALDAMQQAKLLLEKKDNMKAIASQALVQSHQESIMQRLDLVEVNEEIREAQKEAVVRQMEAMEQAVKAQQAPNSGASFDNRITQLEREILMLEERVKTTQGLLKTAEQNFSGQQAKLKDAENRYEHVVAEKQKDILIQRAKRNVQLSQRSLKSSEKIADMRRATFTKFEERLLKSKAELKENRAGKIRLAEDQAVAQEAASKAQNQAIEQQKSVLAQVQQEISRKAAELPEKLGDNETLQKELVGKNDPLDTSKMDAADLYEAAQALENKLTEKFRQNRAMHLAMLQDVPYQAAKDAIDSVNTVHPEIDTDALREGGNTEASLERKKVAARSALEESNSMVMLGNSLLRQVLAGRGDNDSSSTRAISLAAIEARSEEMEKLEQLADQEISGRAVDLAQVMLGTEGRLSSGLADMAVPEINQNTLPVAGRKISDTGEPAQWVAVDEWYILGPFDNAGRANINRVFPPETLIDLNATYLGKGERQISWEFIKTADRFGAIEPVNHEPYGIWYAFTELKFDRARDIWLAMGSDDKGQLWINDTPVWVSGSHHKMWRPAEAFRRVHFHEGRNKILYRVENGQSRMAFSLWLSLMEK